MSITKLKYIIKSQKIIFVTSEEMKRRYKITNGVMKPIYKIVKSTARINDVMT